uniref:Uncharacterized protein n=1 Tax=Trypanosoma vivax (strain Y486) TaxID=1055687 RepID=G0UC93_TRYVY|nr:hypothetical protein TVY486_1109270 [Trypanosoma vivax Y486]
MKRRVPSRPPFSSLLRLHHLPKSALYVVWPLLHSHLLFIYLSLCVCAVPLPPASFPLPTKTCLPPHTWASSTPPATFFTPPPHHLFVCFQNRRPLLLSF